MESDEFDDAWGEDEADEGETEEEEEW